MYIHLFVDDLFYYNYALFIHIKNHITGSCNRTDSVFVFCIVFVFLTLPELKCKLQYLPRYFNSF